MAINPETQYPGKINPSDANYPYGSARNITIPGDGTGTPWEAAIVKDRQGLEQALLTEASIVPSGSPDTAINSQYLQAIKRVTGAPISDMTSLLAVPDGYDGLTIQVISFRPGWAAALTPPLGGGVFTFDSTVAKSKHNGGTIISPTVPWTGAEATLNAFLAGTGETDPSGFGCWRRIYDYANYTYVTWFGATGWSSSIDETARFQAAVDAAALDESASNYHQKAIFVPVPLDGYKITGVDLYQRVDVIGENMWTTRIVVSAQGNYGFESPHLVERIWFDGVAIANGAFRIDEASWARASHRANTGVIMGPADESFEAGHGVVTRCRFSGLGVAIERGNSINTTATLNYIATCWHGIFNRSTTFASMLYDLKNYITNMSGVGMGFYPNANGYNQWDFSGSTIETCCQNAAHDGINGYIDSFGASIKTPGGISVYLENDNIGHPNAIGIRSAIISLERFYMQGFLDPLKSPTTSAFWDLNRGEFTQGTGTYDVVFPSGSGRVHIHNVAFSLGLDANNLHNVTLNNCSGDGILPDGNSNYHMDDGEHYVGNQGAAPARFNRRTDEGNIAEFEQAGTLNFSITSDATATSLIDREAGGMRIGGKNADGTDSQKIVYRKTATTTNRVLTANSNVTANDTVHMEVLANGNINNTNGVYGTLSDERVKDVLGLAGSQWADILALQFKKYQKKDEVAAVAHAKEKGVIETAQKAVADALKAKNAATKKLAEATKTITTSEKLAELRKKSNAASADYSYALGDLERLEALAAKDAADTYLGVIAQDLERSGMGGLVNKAAYEGPDGQRYDTVKMSILVLKCCVALQEAMQRIEALENGRKK